MIFSAELAGGIGSAYSRQFINPYAVLQKKLARFTLCLERRPRQFFTLCGSPDNSARLFPLPLTYIKSNNLSRRAAAEDSSEKE